MTEDQQLSLLGSRLRSERIGRNDSQAAFAARIGISIPTLRKMEEGDGSVRIGHWVQALRVLNRDRDLDMILAPKEDLFAKFDRLNAPSRKRASKKRA
ncbi:helix-turn-helix domain-containing protein [Geobacter sp. FeAm09]|uniref:helix-turn-helix domain-containing protein n=1 Tax=Geobacter sp. FeAm09 TaxID=2597769 RepID=UPI0011EE06F3|nr:helix-turn-helix domain-containing protein [Geobacter sp. FeAm09]